MFVHFVAGERTLQKQAPGGLHPMTIHQRLASPARTFAHVLALGLALSACGTTPTPQDAGTPDTSSGGDTGIAARPNLAGHWNSDCLPSDGGHSLSLAFEMTSTDWTLDY